MRRLPIFIVLAFICLNVGYAGSQEVQEVVTIRVAEFAPNYFKDDAGNWTGLSAELAEAIINAAGFEAKFVELPWSRAIEYIKEGDLLYMTNLYKTDERSEYLHWIGPVRGEDMGLIVHRDYAALPISSLDDLVTVCQTENKRFGIQEDISYSEAFARRIKDDSEFRDCFESVNNVVFNLRKTLYKRIIGFFESAHSMSYRIENDPDYTDLTLHPFVLKTHQVFHGVSRQGVSEEMLAKLRAGYAKCLRNGTIQRILEKWKVQ